MHITRTAVVATAISAGLILHAGFAQEAEKAAPTGASIRMTEPPTKEVLAFVAIARGAFANAPCAQLLSREELTRPGAMGKDWKLHSCEQYGDAKDGIHELLYVAEKPLLDLVRKVEIVLNMKVFSNAAAAREYALERAFSGAAPTESKVHRATLYFGKEGFPGDFCFGPELFVRGNVVVEYGSDITPVVSKRVDACLLELLTRKMSANQAPEDTARKLADPQR